MPLEMILIVGYDENIIEMITCNLQKEDDFTGKL